MNTVEANRWEDDEGLLDDLARALAGTAPVVDTVSRLGRGAFAWRTVDSDLLLAGLSFDSAVDHGAAVRDGAGGGRVLVFSSAPLRVELELLSDSVAGQLLPPSAGEIVIEAADGTDTRIVVDDFGFFRIGAVPRGPVRLRCDTSVARLVTDWFQL